MAQGDRHALDAVGLGQHGLNQGNAFGHGFGGAARVLNVEGGELHAFFQSFLRDEALNLVGLATQAHHQDGGEVRVLGITAQRASQHLQFFAIAGGGATHAMRQRHHAVDVRKISQGLGSNVATEVVGNRACRCGRAVHRGQDANVVASRHTTVRAHDALKGAGLIDIRSRLGIDA